MSQVFLSKDGHILNSGGELLRPAREDGLLGSPAVFGHSLASALDFNAVSLLGKRQMQAPSDPAMLRHSIQPLLPSDNSSQSLSSFDDSKDDSNTTGGPSFDISAFSQQTTDFLMSPPRMTVHLPENTPGSALLTEEAKRRRTAAVQQTPLQFRSSASSESIASARSNPYLGGSMGGDQLLQQTPQKQQLSQQPWMNMQDRSGFFYSVTETPSDISGSMSAYSSQPSSVGSSYNAAKIRRLSLAADENSDIANLTLGLTLPSTQESAAKSSSGSASPYAMLESSDELCSSTDDADACDSPTKSGSTEQAPDSPDPSKNKAGNVWPDNVEVAFWEALRLIPKLGRRKVLVGGKACGRNELIADYIHRKTGVKRSRKQVSSHIQVLKNIKKNDVEFQQLISEPKSDDEYYIPAGGMMYAQTLAGYGYGGLGGQYPLLEMDGIALLSPYTPSGAPDLMAPPLSATTSLTTAMNGMSLPTASAEVKTAPCNSFPILPSSFTMWLLCSQTASRHDYVAMDRKKMASCAQGRQGLPMMPIENIRVGHLRFPMLAEMYQRLPCQFLHVHVPLHVPRFDVANPRYDQFSAQLSLVSTTDARLTSVTTIYSHGKRVLSLVEPLDPPRKIISRSGSETGSSISGANTPASEVPPPTANSSSDGQTSTNKHNFVHQAPFATDFWADFLSRTHPAHIEKSNPPAFGKDPCERAALGMAISGITLVQEFVVASEETINSLGGVEAILGGTGPNAFDPATSVSAGSKIGDVVLVVAWDLECVEALEGPGATSVSLLTMQNRSPSPLRQPTQLPEVTAASPYKSSQMLTVPHVGTPGSSHQQHSFSLPNLTVHSASPGSSDDTINTIPMSASEPMNISNPVQMPTLLRKRGLSVNKPNLMVQIPPAPLHLSMHKNVLQTQAVMRGTPLGSPGVSSASHAATQFGLMQQRDLNTPITPFPQLIHTPDVPPPLLPNVEEAAFQRERLQRHWATVGPPSDLTSPLNPTFDLGGQSLPAATSSQMLLLRANSLSSTLAGAVDIRSDSMSSLGHPMSEGGSSSSVLSPHSFNVKRPSLAAAPMCQRSLSTGALGLDLGISPSLGKAHEIDGQMIQGISSGALEAHQQSASDFSHSSSHDIFEGILAALGASPGALINSLDDVEN
ncbi:hypothetical protein OC846_003308 [Tilletia horrida]|uniref:TEA domain-containing protein n=1 Tax=Tilletia horrida TaxID=155126 RepID=A0AAN6JRE4_9BASI|nr:hypothetical protein OC846_003308 [Tilletia horrida]KAK0568610.1 hypothetical protein OC861_001772 [Tilletia horrida]